MASSAKPVVLEQRDDQSRAAAADVPAPSQTEEHDEIEAQLERMEKGDDNVEETAEEDSKGREGHVNVYRVTKVVGDTDYVDIKTRVAPTI